MTSQSVGTRDTAARPAKPDADLFDLHARQVLRGEKLVPRALLAIKGPVAEFAALRSFHQQIYALFPPRHADRHIQVDFAGIFRPQPLVELGLHLQKFG